MRWVETVGMGCVPLSLIGRQRAVVGCPRLLPSRRRFSTVRCRTALFPLRDGTGLRAQHTCRWWRATLPWTDRISSRLFRDRLLDDLPTGNATVLRSTTRAPTQRRGPRVGGANTHTLRRLVSRCVVGNVAWVDCSSVHVWGIKFRRLGCGANLDRGVFASSWNECIPSWMTFGLRSAFDAV